jgi:hypothetical protein
VTLEKEQNQVVVETSKELPSEFVEYVKGKLAKNGEGGRPHILALISRERDPQEELLNILELAWIKDRNIGTIATSYNTKYLTIYRMLKDLEPIKAQLADYLRTVTRRKRWYIPELDTSDYETIQNYIRRAKRDGVKTYKKSIVNARRVWTALNYRDPANWTADDVCTFLASLTTGAQSRCLDAIRQIAPHLKDEVKTGRFREKLNRRKKDLFGNEVNMIRKALSGRTELLTMFDLHITLGAREGSTNSKSGLVGLSWESFKNSFTRVDLFESKVRGGIWWRNCPLDLFFQDLPERLKKLWVHRGKPTSERIFSNGYKGVTGMYKQIRQVLREFYEGKVDPSLLKEFVTLRPHDADKVHVNLLWEAGVPLEVVGGQYLGQSEGLGLMGRGWLDVNVIKKYYLSLTQRSERFQKLEAQVRDYSTRFSTPD